MRLFVFLKYHKVSARSFSIFLRVLSFFLPTKLKFRLLLADLMGLFLKTDVWP